MRSPSRSVTWTREKRLDAVTSWSPLADVRQKEEGKKERKKEREMERECARRGEERRCERERREREREKEKKREGGSNRSGATAWMRVRELELGMFDDSCLSKREGPCGIRWT